MLPDGNGGAQSSWPFALLIVLAIGLLGASVLAPRLHVHVAVGAGIALGGYLILTFLSRTVGPRREERRRAVPRLTRELLLAGRCASCEQSLEGLATASDGCCVCSECGSAWNVEAMGVELRRLESRATRDREDWFLQQVRVADVRGWERPILVARRDAEARRACREAGQSLPPFWHSADGAASACAVIFCIVHTAFRGYGPWTVSGMVAAICTPIVASFYWSYRKKRRTKSVELLACSMIRQGRCPCCEVELPAENAALIDAKICAACGAAWDAERVTAVALGESRG
jgi:transcription elongation factor Elf1